MKRTLLFLVAVLAVVATGCHKEKRLDPTKPTITWEANSSFNTVELTSNLDAAVTVKAPGLFQDLKLVLDLGNYNILANPYISNSANKGGANAPVLDLIADGSSVAFVNGLGMKVGPTLQNKDSVALDLKVILEKILEGQPVENNTSFAATIRVKDQSGNEVTKVARFHFTAAPSFTWVKNQSFSEVDLDAAEMDCKVEVWAPGKIDQLTVTLGTAADPSLKMYVKNRTSENTTAIGEYIIDLVNDPKVADSFKDWFPAGNAVSGKDQAVLNFGFLYALKYDLEPSVNVFSVTVVDKNGKSNFQSIRFRKN